MLIEPIMGFHTEHVCRRSYRLHNFGFCPLDFYFPPFTLSGPMNSITSITPQQLRRAADIQERIQSLQDELTSLLGGGAAPAAAGAPAGRKPRRRLSAAGLANIRAGARRRWAALRAQSGASAPQPHRKRHMSAAGRARLAAIAKARWARIKAQGKSRL